jgi:monoamine oxidase
MREKTKIIVVGAGMAGLSAANVLLAAGFEVVILEASHRYGGRIGINNDLGVPVGCGATWLHGTENNPLQPLFEQYPTQTFPFDSNKFCRFDRQGNAISLGQAQAFDKKFELALEKAKEWATEQQKSVSLATALANFIDPATLSEVEQDLFQRKLKFFEAYVGAEYELLSAQHWSEEDNILGGNAVVTDAYAKIMAGLAANCVIKFNAVVSDVRTQQDGVSIVTNQGEFSAAAVIITVPLGVLKQQRIVFTPALSSQKQQAISRLGMGLLNIVAMHFTDVFWPQGASVFFLADSPTCSVFLNATPFLEWPILLGYVGGKTARMLETMPEKDVLKATLTHLEKTFKFTIPMPENYFMTRWSQCPWSFGSYSYLPVDATPADRDALASPEGRLFFAGEATSRDYPATVQGAYVSGMRAAEEVKRFFRLG